MMPLTPPGPGSLAVAVSRWIRSSDIFHGSEG
jgi:hypothetical protein